MLNLFVATGRLTHDPELRQIDSGVPVANFSIAIPRDYKVDGEYPTDFPNCVAWRKTAEFVCKHFKKGSMITVVGRVETRKYADKDGNPRTATEVNVNSAYFGDSAKKNNGNDDSQEASGGYGTFEPDFGGGNSIPFSGGFPAFGG